VAQLKGLWRDTWFLWLGFVVLLIAMSVLLSWFFLLMSPALLVSFCYFAFIRYDEQGNEKVDY
tara:strand:- start:73249 stop:73437 length:189 start_codon:yes stop_codon:yes gene_type:complete